MNPHLPAEAPPIFVVSLERAGDRKAFVHRVFHEAGLEYEIVPAVDAKALGAAELATYSSRRAVFEYGRELSRGVLACSLSHLRVLQRIIDEGLEAAVVFEDDTRPLPGFGDLLTAPKLVPDDCDVLTFHSLYDWASATPVSEEPVFGDFRLCRYGRTPMGTQAYLITRRGAERVLDVAFPVSLPSDEILFRPRPAALEVYGVEPSPVAQEDFPSEIDVPAPPLRDHSQLTRVALQLLGISGRAWQRVERLRRPTR